MSSPSYFDEVAGRWDRMREGFFSVAVREKAFSAAGLVLGRLAVDIGAGTGFITEGLIERGLQVIAVDPSPSMGEMLRKKFKDCPAVAWRAGRAARLPLADGTVDYAFANMVLHHVEDPQASLREMTRILKVGGRLVVTDLDEHHNAFLREEHHDRWMGFNQQQVEAWFSAAGFAEVRVGPMEEQCCACSRDSTCKADVSIFLASGVKEAE